MGSDIVEQLEKLLEDNNLATVDRVMVQELLKVIYNYRSDNKFRKEQHARELKAGIREARTKAVSEFINHCERYPLFKTLSESQARTNKWNTIIADFVRFQANA